METNQVEHILDIMLRVFFFLSLAKSLIIGSQFSFYNWFKYGKIYYNWYSKTILDAKFVPPAK